MSAVRLLVIVVGGAVGTCLRSLVEDAVPAAPTGWPWATFLINVSGALLLGVLLETLVHRGPDEGPRRLVRLGLGTGVLGGWTTYSTFAVEVAQRTSTTTPFLGPAYAVATVLLGGVAAAVGFRLAVGLAGRGGVELGPSAPGGDTE